MTLLPIARPARAALYLGITLAAAALPATPAAAGGFTVQGGQAEGISRFSLGYTADPVYTRGNLSILPVYEIARFHTSDRGRSGIDTLWQVSAVPMFRYHIDSFYLEAGIGVSLFNHTMIGDKDFSTRFQFSDHIGFGYRFSPNLTVGYRFSHFSNAGIKTPNPGINSQAIMVNFSY